MGDKTLLQNEGGRLGGSLKDTQSTLKHFSGHGELAAPRLILPPCRETAAGSCLQAGV